MRGVAAPGEGARAPGPGTRAPGTASAYALIRALLHPVWRSLPRRALASGAVLGLLIAGAPWLLSVSRDSWPGLNILRASALAFGLGLAFLLDDPARHTTAAVPIRRPVRIGLRVAFAVPIAAIWWTAALLLVPGDVRPPVGAVTLEAAAVAALALAGAAVAVRCTEAAEPGVGVSAGLLGGGLAAGLLLPHDLALVVAVNDPRWDGAHERWAGVLVVAVVVGVAAWAEPLRRRSVMPALRR
ncbi:ABC transporter [Streptomyces sp. NBC_00038]|uniref:ABC transporter n=1 Tax=Streptomyces sp. NBC_00038 TaxID=2903615 RepID=UPI00225C16F6|nr:ABC transporter [Streptomyces sp. NBC_00038]MCX5558779.1 ABC transporter [Streptomyces sp. NBC_00038]